MNFKTITMKAAGGLFAAGIAATALFGGASSASADRQVGPQSPAPGGQQGLTVACAGKPDIRFERVRVEQHLGQMVAYIQFSNQGCATPTGFPVSIHESAPSYAQVTKIKLQEPAMAGGEARQRIVVLGLITPEMHGLYVALDAQGDGGSGVISESNEYNNFGTLSFQM